MLPAICCVVGLTVMVAGPLFAQASLPDTLSEQDRDVVRAMLDVRLVLSGLPADSIVLLHSTSPMCAESGGRAESGDRGCVGTSLLNVSSWPIREDCEQTDVAALRTAFVARNAGTWRLGTVQATIPASDIEIRILSAEVLRERFPDEWFVELSAPAYSPDGRFALVVAQQWNAHRPGRRVGGQVFARTDASWTPIRCTFFAR